MVQHIQSRSQRRSCVVQLQQPNKLLSMKVECFIRTNHLEQQEQQNHREQREQRDRQE
jgi:hypothetical protein